MTEYERDQILLNLNKKVNQFDVVQKKLVYRVDAIQEKVSQIDAIQEKVSQIDAIQEKVNQIDAIQEKVNQIDAIQEKVIMQNDIRELKEETRRISKSVAFIEHDHGKKIDTLIDITKGLLEEQTLFKKKLNSFANILDNHSDRIWNLESKLGII